MSNVWKYVAAAAVGAFVGAVVTKNSDSIRNASTKAIGHVLDAKDSAARTIGIAQEGIEDFVAEAFDKKKKA